MFPRTDPATCPHLRRGGGGSAKIVHSVGEALDGSGLDWSTAGMLQHLGLRLADLGPGLADLGPRLADLVLATECAACRRPGTRWCPRCRLALERLELGPSPVPVRPRPLPPLMPPTHAAVAYADPVRAAVSAWKDADRRDLLAVLGPVLERSVRAAVAAAGWRSCPVLVVPAPSSAGAERRRGDAPLLDLAEWVGRQPGLTALRVVPALRQVRRVADQSGLTITERRRNLSGAMAVKAQWHNVIRDRNVIVVDDVVTTGATVAEAARALRRAGALHVVAAAVAAAQRHERP